MRLHLITLMILSGILVPACDVEQLTDGEEVSADPGANDQALAELPAPDAESPSSPASAAQGLDPDDAAKLPGPDAAYPNDASQRAQCLSDCAKLELSDDDRATCRLQCAPAPSPETLAARRYLECHASCVARGDEANDRCERECREAMTAPLFSDGSTASGCTDPCFDALNACAFSCTETSKGAHASDGAATCKLQCESTAIRCLEACEAA